MPQSDTSPGAVTFDRTTRTEEQLEHQRLLALRSWEMRPPRRVHHPVYRARRIADRRTVAQHMLGTLIVLGALMLIART